MFTFLPHKKLAAETFHGQWQDPAKIYKKNTTKPRLPGFQWNMKSRKLLSPSCFRTEMLECLGDLDFLAKLHCVRQACEVTEVLYYHENIPIAVIFVQR